MEIDQSSSLAAFTYLDSVTNLVELAACRLALTLLSDSLQDPSDHYETIFKKQIDQLLKRFKKKIKNSAKDAISLYHQRICKSTSMWVSYHKERVFTDADVELIMGMCLPELVWRSDGSIDGARSAEALVKSAMLSDEQEYRMVCLYCMENKIEGAWRRLADSNSLLLDTSFEDEVSLLSYWNSRMTSRCCNVASDNSFRSAENRLICNEAADNFTSAGYFLDRLDVEELVSKGCRMIPAVKSDHRAEYVRRLLTKFSSQQLSQAFQTHCSDIMYPLIMNRTYNQCALQVWPLVANSLTIQSFLSLMIRIASTINVVCSSSNNRFEGEIDTCEDFKKRIFTLVEELWKISPESLRRHELVSATRGVIYTLTKCFVKITSQVDSRNSRFLSTILSDASTNLRSYVMRSIGLRLAPKCRPRIMMELINICSAEDFGRRFFRNQIIRQSVTSNFEKFRDRKFAELQEFFEAFVSSPAEVNEQKRIILKCADHRQYLFTSGTALSDEQVEFARRFISDAFTGNDEEGAKFKKRFCERYPRLWEIAEPQPDMEVES